MRAVDGRSPPCQPSQEPQCLARRNALSAAAGRAAVAGRHRHSLPDLRCFSDGAAHVAGSGAARGSSRSRSRSSSGWGSGWGGAPLQLRCSSSLAGGRVRGERLDVVEEVCEGCRTPEGSEDEGDCIAGSRGGSAGDRCSSSSSSSSGSSSSSSGSDGAGVGVIRPGRRTPELQRTPSSTQLPIKRTAIIAMANMNRLARFADGSTDGCTAMHCC